MNYLFIKMNYYLWNMNNLFIDMNFVLIEMNDLKVYIYK